ncbi:MAG: hypothetical protein WCD79_23900 [Chthoniobacteraceae bacterium]
MDANDEVSARNSDLKALLVFFLVAIAAFHAGSAWKGYGLYRDIHLDTALHYAETRIDLAHTVIVGFNATETPTIQELPIWQALAGLAFKVLGPWRGWANVVSLAIFFTCLFPLFRIGRTALGVRGAYWSLVFFVSQPLIFEYAGMASTDGISLVAAIWFCFFSMEMVREPGLKWFLPACIAGSLTAVLKLPFFMAGGIAIFVLLVKQHGFDVRRILLLAGVGGIAAVLFLVWTRYTDAAQAGAVFPYVDLRVSKNPQMVWWYFGDWKYRLTPGNWIKGGWRMLNSLCGSFVFVGLVIYALARKGGSTVAKCLLLGGVVTTLTFSHLVLHHTHYYMMFAPVVAILCADALAIFESRFPSAGATGKWRIPLAGLLLLLSLVQGLIGMKAVLHYDTFPARMAQIIRENTKDSDKLVIRGGGWGGDLLTRSNRKGLSVWDTHIFENPANFALLKSMGFNKLVMVSESPLLDALQRVNPGETDRKRETYQPSTTAIIKDWPTLYQDDDILVKEIP